MNVGEDRVGFGEGAQVFGPVVPAQPVFGRLVQADADVPVGLTCSWVGDDVIFGEHSVAVVASVLPSVDAAA